MLFDKGVSHTSCRPLPSPPLYKGRELLHWYNRFFFGFDLRSILLPLECSPLLDKARFEGEVSNNSASESAVNHSIHPGIFRELRLEVSNNSASELAVNR